MRLLNDPNAWPGSRCLASCGRKGRTVPIDGQGTPYCDLSYRGHGSQTGLLSSQEPQQRFHGGPGSNRAQPSAGREDPIETSHFVVSRRTIGLAQDCALVIVKGAQLCMYPRGRIAKPAVFGPVQA